MKEMDKRNAEYLFIFQDPPLLPPPTNHSHIWHNNAESRVMRILPWRGDMGTEREVKGCQREVRCKERNGRQEYRLETERERWDTEIRWEIQREVRNRQREVRNRENK
jgi:hypothetical protein